jgi:hypothetical protein
VSIAIVGAAVTGNGATIAKASVTAGSLLTLQTAYFRNPSTGLAEAIPTDSQGTWSTASAGVPGIASGLDSAGSIFYQANVAAGTHTVTPQANNSKNCTLVEWSGATTTPLDGSANAATNSFSGTSQVTGTTATTAQADELSLTALGLAAAGGAADVGFTDPVSGYTTLQKQSNDLTDIAAFHAYKILVATGTQSATFNWTDTEAAQFCGAAIATFKASAAAGGNVLMGQCCT